MAATKTSNAKRKSYLPKDANGKVKGGPGRPKGVPNKITTEAKTAIAMAFEGIGGLPALITWAKKNATNRAIFYTHIYTKLIPVQVAGKIDLREDSSASHAAAVFERILLGIIDSRQDGSEEAPVIIDAEPNREPTPQLVLSSSARTKAA